jgi:hypothetical protein
MGQPVEHYVNGKPIAGDFYRLSTEEKPTAADGARDGSGLLLVDTGEVFVFYSGVWRTV